jgi:pimeloyl-ACP methyl ester carboxylesterase
MSAALLALALSLAGRDSGWVAGPDGVRLYYEKIGNGPRTIIVPGRLFLARDLAPLGERHTLILYDMRNRGRSSRVEDGTLLTIQKDVEDLDAVRRHFRVERFVPVGYSYLGFMVVLYAMSHPDQVERVVQLGPVPRKFDTEYPSSLLHADSVPVVDSATAARMDSLERSRWAREHPKKFCEESRRPGVGADPAERSPHHRRACRPPGDGRRARGRPSGDRDFRGRAVAGAGGEDHLARARPAPVIARAAALPRNASSTICACCSMP